MKKFQRIDENIFKLMEVNELPHEEVATAWEEDKNGEYIQVGDNKAAYIAHGSVMEQIPAVYGNIWTGIQHWMKTKGFYPNIWSVNDHGNVSMYDRRGNYLGGLV